jgi:two-component system phosphate regulon sensor histidine kinase PhoR
VHNVKGFGLGLFYVKSICKAHNWEILVDSEVGKGSVFEIDMSAYLDSEKVTGTEKSA